MRLANKVAIITGAASGVGRASAIIFAREGAQVAVVDINVSGGKEAVEQIIAQNGRTIFIEADVSRSADAQRVAEETLHSFGRIDILFNNAAVTSFGRVDKLEEEEIDRVLAVNLKSIFFCSKWVIPYMRRTGGVILNMSSITGLVGAQGMAIYSATKGAIITLTRTMALEYAKENIRVNCICPASIDTPMLRSSFLHSPDPEQARKENIGRHPLGRLGTPEDVAYLALFLASDEASWITGGTYVIDGGASIARVWK